MSEVLTAPEDPYLWLEEIRSPEALAWVGAQNTKTLAALADDAFNRDKDLLASIMGATDHIPFVGQVGEHFYNFWQDTHNPRGIWRRTTLSSYRGLTTEWEVLLDVDALGRNEDEDWVFNGATSLPPRNERWLITLSRGGADACVMREFDLRTRRFLDAGFCLPESKTGFSWLDQDCLLVASPLGDGHATSSGYPRTVRRWRRGTPLSEAEVIFEGRDTDLSVSGVHDHEPGFARTLLTRTISWFASERTLLLPSGERMKLELPLDALLALSREWLTLQVRSPWKPMDREFATDSLIAIRLEAFLQGSRDFDLLFEPRERRSLQGVTWSKSRLALSVLDNMRSEVLFAEPGGEGWHITRFAGVSETESIAIGSVGADATGATSERFFLTINGYLRPTSLYLLDPGEPMELLKQAPAQFEAAKMVVSLHDAVAEDGVRIPYFQVSGDHLPLNGDNPTILYGYGGFSVPMSPGYMATIGKVWLERGGVFVVANIRGGGEFGTAWHKAGTREGKKRAQDDFAVVARALIVRGVATPDRLACWGGSNGGLLVGNMLTRFPQLFGAVWCELPLLDMRRYTKFPPGASWIEEYGDPDNPEDWAFLQEISAYHLASDAVIYPPIFIWTSAADDRTHPGHARKMGAKLQALGQRALFYEPEEGGHGFADLNQAAFGQALGFSFLRHTICGAR